MAEAAAPSGRLHYLDGLRGVAALQVVAYHYASAFLPAMVGMQPNRPLIGTAWQTWFAGSVLYAGINGPVDVNIFFLLSGFVLRRAFRDSSFWPGVARRVIRLGIPAMVAIFIAALFILAAPLAHLRAARLSGSEWLHILLHQPPTLLSVFHEAFISSIFMGYEPSSVFDNLPMIFSLQTQTTSLDPPIWTLNIELAGSLICLALAILHRRQAALLTFVFLAALMLCGDPTLFLFVLGFYLAGAGERLTSRMSLTGPAIMLILGLLLCSQEPFRITIWLWYATTFAHPSQFPNFCDYAGSILVFLAVLTMPWLHRALSAPLPQWLGKISFSLYLVHFPIMATFGCLIFIAAQPALGNPLATLAAFIAGLAVTLPASMVFARWIDAPAVWLSRPLLPVHRLTGPA